MTVHERTDSPAFAASTGADVHRNSETKISTKTSEMIVYVFAVLAVVVTAIVVGGDDGSADPFGADQAIKYITFLTVGYMIARGLAKSGSRATTSTDSAAISR